MTAVVPTKADRPRTAIFRWVRRNASPSTVIAALFLLTVLLLIVVVPFLPSYDPYAQDLMFGMASPGEVNAAGHTLLLGADFLGRDTLSRLALAGRISISIASAAVAISFVIGLSLGLIAGFFGGLAENVIMGLADLQMAIPRMLLLVAVTALVGPSVAVLILVLGLTSWVSYGRVARAMAISLRHREFVLAAITQGATSSWNIRKHLLPNVMPQMVIVASFELGQMISLEAALSYLGLGLQPPLPSWGMMISEGQGYLTLDPWLSVFPGIAIFFLIAGVQFLTRHATAEDGDDLEAGWRGKP